MRLLTPRRRQVKFYPTPTNTEGLQAETSAAVNQPCFLNVTEPQLCQLWQTEPVFQLPQGERSLLPLLEAPHLSFSVWLQVGFVLIYFVGLCSNPIIDLCSGPDIGPVILIGS